MTNNPGYLLIRILLCFAAMAGAVYADEAPRQFDIELLIFQNLNTDDGGEVWPVDYSEWFNDDTPEFDNTQSETSSPTPSATGHPAPSGLNAPTPSAPGIPVWLAPGTLHLQAEAQTLKRSAGYHLLRHLAWRQSVVDRKHAQDIELPAASNDTPVRVEGTVRVAVERYLHLYLDLKLVDTTLTLNADFSDYDLPEFRMTQHRRMRSKELHYFDHPKFGVIALITPYVPPEPAPVNAQVPEGSVPATYVPKH